MFYQLNYTPTTGIIITHENRKCNTFLTKSLRFLPYVLHFKTIKLLENNLFETGSLNAVNGYISELIDDISTDFTYDYKVDKDSNIIYLLVTL